MTATISRPALVDQPYLSYTQLTTFQRCPLKWQFQYAEHRPRERLAASLAFGASIHVAIELHFRTLLAGLPAPGIEELLAAYDQAWEAEAAVPVQLGAGDEPVALRQRAHQLLVTFSASQTAQADGEILGVEEELRCALVPGLPELLARVDLLVRTNSALLVRDFKTARSRWSAEQLAEAAPQLILYGALATPLARQFGDLPVHLEFVVLTKSKQPRVDVCPVAADSYQMGRLRTVLRKTWSAIQAGHIYPNPSPMNCAACPFPQACRDWRG